MNEPTTDQEAPTTKSRRVAKGMVLLIAFGVIAFGLFLARAVKDAREAACHAECRDHLGQLMLALHIYHDTYKALPPAYLADADGKPIHSWRVLLLPVLDGHATYKQYDFSEPWDGPNNRKLANSMVNLDIFQCPSGPNYRSTSMTDYVVIVGPKTAFPGTRSTTFDDFQDGLENTILIVEIANSDIHWMEPRDLNVEEMSFILNDPKKPSISSPHPCGPASVFANERSAYPLDASLRPETLEALTTIAGGEPVFKEKLLREPRTFERYLAE